MRYLIVPLLALALWPATASAGHGHLFLGFGVGFTNVDSNCGSFGFVPNYCGPRYTAAYPPRFYAPYSRFYTPANYYCAPSYYAPIQYYSAPVGTTYCAPRPICPAPTYCAPTYPSLGTSTYHGSSTFLTGQGLQSR